MKVTILRIIRDDCMDTRTCPTLAETDQGTYLVVGKVVSDPAALGALGIGPGEQAVEIPAALLER
jgi:hypothetical protein